MITTKVVDDDLSLGVLKVLNDLRTNYAFAYWQHVSTMSCGKLQDSNFLPVQLLKCELWTLARLTSSRFSIQPHKCMAFCWLEPTHDGRFLENPVVIIAIACS